MENLETYTELENLIWECTDESLERAKDMMHLFDKKTVFKLIFRVADFRIFSFKKLADLFEYCGETDIVFPIFYQFSLYLYARGILKENNFDSREGPPDSRDLLPLNKYENPVRANTLQFFVLSNDVKGLDAYKGETELNGVFFEVLGKPFSLPSFAAFCGSLDVLRYLRDNNAVFDEDITSFAIEGGSESVMQYLINEGFSFDYCLEIAIKWHHNEIAKKLIENNECEDIELPLCIENFNTEMHRYFVEKKGRKVDEKPHYRRKFEMYLASHSNDILKEYILL